MAHPYVSATYMPTNFANGSLVMGGICPGSNIFYQSHTGLNYGQGVSTTLWRYASRHTSRDAFGWRAPRDYLFGKSVSSTQPPGKITYGCSHYYKPYPSSLDSHWQWTPSGFQYPPDTFTLTNAKRALRTRALVGLKRTEVNLAETFAERKQTYRMVTSGLKSAIMYYRLLRRGRFGEAAKRLFNENPAAAWLTYRYGIMPLVYETYGLAKWIEDLEQGSYEHLRVYTKKRITRPMDYSHSSSYGGLNFVTKTKGEYTVKCRYDYRRTGDFQYVALRDLGILDPQLLAWELIPYSFVADWFINIGDFLEAQFIGGSWQYLSGSLSLFSEAEEVGHLENVGSNYYEAGAVNNFSNKIVHFKRDVEAAPTPQLALEPGSLISQLSPHRIVDLISLLTVAVTGKSGNYRR